MVAVGLKAPPASSLRGLLQAGNSPQRRNRLRFGAVILAGDQASFLEFSMSSNRQEVLVAAKRLRRSFAGAPDPRRHARSFCQTVRSIDDLTVAESQDLAAFAAWLDDNPPSSALEPRCRNILASLLK